MQVNRNGKSSLGVDVRDVKEPSLYTGARRQEGRGERLTLKNPEKSCVALWGLRRFEVDWLYAD